MTKLVPLMCLLGMGVALVRGWARDVPAAPAARDDVPARLLRWAVGLLSAQRAEWGQAMLGELGNIDGRSRRWRFAVGCAGAALLLPPWGRTVTAVWAMAAVAAGSVGLYAFAGIRYGLEAGDWAFAAVPLVFVAGYALMACVLVRQPRVAVPGLLCGLLVALAWLVLYGYSFDDVIANPVTALWVPAVLLVGVPLLVGVAGTLWGGSHAAGRRIAWLAAISASLYMFLYGTIAVVALGAGGPAGDPGCTGSCLVGDRLGSNTIFYLWGLPLMTTAFGWAAAAATARIRPRLATSMVPVPFTAASHGGGGGSDPALVPEVAVPHEAGGRSWRRAGYLVLLCAVVAACLLLAALGASRG
jgi:hypothetical protein